MKYDILAKAYFNRRILVLFISVSFVIRMIFLLIVFQPTDSFMIYLAFICYKNWYEKIHNQSCVTVIEM